MSELEIEKCPECEEMQKSHKDYCVWCGFYKEESLNYCVFCGAQMDEKEGEENG